MNLVFSPQGWADYQHWQETDRKIVKRINLLIKDTIRRPTDGIGKPEPLRHALAGYWFRRITAEHRFVYKVVGDDLRIAQLRYHYEKSEPNVRQLRGLDGARPSTERGATKIRTQNPRWRY